MAELRGTSWGHLVKESSGWEKFRGENILCRGWYVGMPMINGETIRDGIDISAAFRWRFGCGIVANDQNDWSIAKRQEPDGNPPLTLRSMAIYAY